jgi:hypothetical protein
VPGRPLWLAWPQNAPEMTAAESKCCRWLGHAFAKSRIVWPRTGVWGTGMPSATSAAIRGHAYLGNEWAFPSFLLDRTVRQPTIRRMGFNRRKMEDERRRLAEKEAAARRANDAQGA